ncbi:hypothetical protein QTJ16_005537 [Diplocarpon rosae]|uniref:Uncharacterized protein n=1 Tax=Diplocarpon rosae TaxID=946125 RepID=A0AAD9SXX2_9HELO|nr:hypothetical protein QTJ16_005537 [Diplocarpon rosae]
MSIIQLESFLQRSHNQLERDDPASPRRVFIYDLPRVFIDNFPAARLLGSGVVKGWIWHMNVLSDANIRPAFQSDVSPTSDYLLCKPFLKSTYDPRKPLTSVCGLIFELTPVDMSRLEAHIQRNSSAVRYRIGVVATVKDIHTGHLRCFPSTTYIDPLNTNDGRRVHITSPAEKAKWLAQIEVFRARKVPGTYLDGLLNQLRGAAIPGPQPIYVVPMETIPDFTPLVRPASALPGHIRPLPLPPIPKESHKLSNTFKITPESVGIEKFTRYFQASIKSIPSNLPHVRQELQDQFDKGNERYRNQLQAMNQHHEAKRQRVISAEHQTKLQQKSGPKQQARMHKQAKSSKRARVQSEDEGAAEEAARAQPRPRTSETLHTAPLQPQHHPSRAPPSAATSVPRPLGASETAGQRSRSPETLRPTATPRPQSSVSSQAADQRPQPRPRFAAPRLPPCGIFRTSVSPSQSPESTQAPSPCNSPASTSETVCQISKSSGTSSVAPRPLSAAVPRSTTARKQMTGASARRPETAAEIGEKRLREYAGQGSRGSMWASYGGLGTPARQNVQTGRPGPARQTGSRGPANVPRGQPNVVNQAIQGAPGDLKRN